MVPPKRCDSCLWLVVTGGSLLLEAGRKANVPDDLGSDAVCTAQTQKCKDMTLLVLGFFYWLELLCL